MIDITKLPLNIVGCVAQQLGHEPEKKVQGQWPMEILAEISVMDEFEVVDRYLKWNGIIGYTTQLMTALENIKACVIK
jgi:hypothetical protein